MNILCLNTAFKTAQIAISGKKNVFVSLDANAKSSENVLPSIEDALIEAGLDISAIDCIGVVVGPGSFTGLRVGAGLVKGVLACFPHIKAVAIDSLDLMAFQWRQSGTAKDFCAVQNALSGRFFVKNYQNYLPLGVASLQKELPTTFKIGLESENLSEVDAFVEPTAEVLLDLTKNFIEKGDFVSGQNLAPVYLRLSQAEENLLKKEENA